MKRHASPVTLEPGLSPEPLEAASPPELPEHPLAETLRAVLENPALHRVGDLARVLQRIRREMAMLDPPEPAPAADREADLPPSPA